MNTRSYPIFFGVSTLGMILLGALAFSLGIQHATPLSDPRTALPPLLASAAGGALIVVSGFPILCLARVWADQRWKQTHVERDSGLLIAVLSPALSTIAVFALAFIIVHSSALDIATLVVAAGGAASSALLGFRHVSMLRESRHDARKGKDYP